MDQDIHFSARMLMLAGWLMACSSPFQQGKSGKDAPDVV